MGIGGSLQITIREWGVLVMFIVVMSIILLKMRVTSSVVCESGTYNATSNLCCDAACSLSNSTPRALYTDIGTYVTAFSEPKNWVIIVIIALIGVAMLKLFNKIKSK